MDAVADSLSVSFIVIIIPDDYYSYCSTDAEDYRVSIIIESTVSSRM